MSAGEKREGPGDEQHLPVMRMELLTDAVFAIVMTLMVLSFDVPDVSDESELPGALLDLWPTLVSYVVTFAVLGFNWIAHHSLYRYVSYLNRPLIWLNLCYLMVIGLLPFTTDLHSRYVDDPFTVFVYGGNLMIVSIFFIFQWYYVSRAGDQLDTRLSHVQWQRMGMRSFVTTGAFAVGIAAAFITPYLAIPLWSLMPLWQRLAARVYAGRLPAGA
jgi:uncharacterized membrane protein